MYKIAIIGVGQLGSRHLQGVIQSKYKCLIEVVEPFDKSVKIAKERVKEVNEKKLNDIQFYNSISELSNELDIVIIATTADVRKDIIVELLYNKKVKYLILEKVLFQTIEDYYDIEKLLEEKNVLCWVNHPRRLFPFYTKLKKEIQNSKKIFYNYHGGNWGLGCNALHFIDHLLFLSNSSDDELILDTKFLDNKIYNSSRSKFVEFNGLLLGKLNEHVFTLYSNVEYMPSLLTIMTDNLSIYIDEERGIIKKIYKENNIWKEDIIKEKIIYFQSELSNLIVDSLLKDSTCALPKYKEAMKIHIVFIKSLLSHMNKINQSDSNICPIT